METQTMILYEIIDSETNDGFVTEDSDTAIDYFHDGWKVYERHVTLCNPEEYLQSHIILTMAWHLNPKRKGGIK